MKKEELGGALRWDECVECGTCLRECRYLGLSADGAVEEIRKINRGEPSVVTERCVSCYACDAFCPRGAHPYERIHYAWDERYRRTGLPARARYLMPDQRPNFRQDVNFSAREKRLLEKWSAPAPPARTVLYPGCNLMTLPLLADGAIFERLPVWGNWGLCCGEMFFRMGLLDRVERTARELTAFYADTGIEEMVFVCSACYNMFGNVLPGQFGARFGFRITFFTDWFWREVDAGRLAAPGKLAGSVAVHDSCHARVLGTEFMETQRAGLRRLGLETHDTVTDLKRGLCCGMASGARRYSVADLARYTVMGLRELDRAEGDLGLAYCTGCLLTFSMARLARPFGKKLVHPLELYRKALGEKALRRNIPRALSILAGISLKALPKYFSRDRFRLENGEGLSVHEKNG
ncbi:MAG TPA: (Fe-S)-binding protein [Spirochaetota bacterium]|nr:(Fe-S)-binding protein [Spirochaetota bacterium]